MDPDQLNSHFNSTATRLNKNASTVTNMHDLLHNVSNDNDANFNLQPTDYHTILKQIKSLKNDCSTGYDTIPVRFIKPVAEYLASPLTNIINNCISKNTFPKQWKVARVHPIPKVSPPTNADEFRPISVLPIMSKIFERVILIQLCNQIEKHHTYSSTQSGFRKGHSTVTVLLKLRDDILKGMNRSEVTLAFAADFSKAFDTVSYLTLINKLISLNFSVPFIETLISYLAERTQYVQIDDKQSQNLRVKFGVPQGSILGPVLFNIYVSDLSLTSENQCLQYADDTTIYSQCKVKQISDVSKNSKMNLNP